MRTSKRLVCLPCSLCFLWTLFVALPAQNSAAFAEDRRFEYQVPVRAIPRDLALKIDCRIPVSRTAYRDLARFSYIAASSSLSREGFRVVPAEQARTFLFISIVAHDLRIPLLYARDRVVVSGRLIDTNRALTNFTATLEKSGMPITLSGVFKNLLGRQDRLDNIHLFTRDSFSQVSRILKKYARDQVVKPAIIAKHSGMCMSKSGRRDKDGAANVRCGSDRAEIEAIIEIKSRQYGIHSHFIRAIIKHESNWNPTARSKSNAMGLMQLMPATAKELGVTNPWSPEENIDGGTRYIAMLLREFSEDPWLALCAYHAGPTRARTNTIPEESIRYANAVMNSFYDFD